MLDEECVSALKEVASAAPVDALDFAARSKYPMQVGHLLFEGYLQVDEGDLSLTERGRVALRSA